MALGQGTSTEIALNVTRTRLTVLVFNLTIIALMLSIVATRGTLAEHAARTHLTTMAALFIGFCMTLLGIWWLLFSQNWNPEGLSRPFSFTMGSITTYLALSQTITAFVHEYLVGVASMVETAQPVVPGGTRSLVPLHALGSTELMILVVMGGTIWVGVTYVAPVTAGFIKSPVRGAKKWVFVGYYLVLQLPTYWVYAKAWHLQNFAAEQPTGMLSTFALQFFQPVFWLR